jgi:hypothetical protein
MGGAAVGAGWQRHGRPVVPCRRPRRREKPWVVETWWLTGGLHRFEIPTNSNLIQTWFAPKLTFSCLKILSKIPGDSFR